ncbi:MAG: 23S rRNA (guanosine(2251)-2'-O)-methyltransferase RlmB [Byssovorax sp.]
MGRAIFGIQPVREAIRVHGAELERIFVQQSGGPTLEGLIRFAEGRGVTVELVSRGDLDRRAAGGRHQGAIALAPELRLVPLESLEVGPAALFVALDGVMDPQNFGAVIRSAVALGATAILWPEHSSAPLSPATFRASAGAIEHAALCRVPQLAEALQALAARGVMAVALDAQGTIDLGAVDLRGPVVIVIGAEDKGIRRPVRAACQHTARLPMRGPVGSLNASVAGAIALYEVVRQRSAAP